MSLQCVLAKALRAGTGLIELGLGMCWSCVLFCCLESDRHALVCHVVCGGMRCCCCCRWVSGNPYTPPVGPTYVGCPGVTGTFAVAQMLVNTTSESTVCVFVWRARAVLGAGWGGPAASLSSSMLGAFASGAMSFEFQ